MILKVRDYRVYFSAWMFPAVLLKSVINSKWNVDAAGDIMVLISGGVFRQYKLHREIKQEAASCSSGHNLFNTQTAQFI